MSRIQMEVLVGAEAPPIYSKARFVNEIILEVEGAGMDLAVGQFFTVERVEAGLVTRYTGAPCVRIEDGMATIDLTMAVTTEQLGKRPL